MTLDGRQAKGDVLFVEIMNIGLVGPNLRLAPAADPGDDRLDVVVVPADRREEMLAWLENPELQDPPVLVEAGRQVAVATNGAPLRVGDRKPGDAGRGSVFAEIEGEAATILVPPTAANGTASHRRSRER
jgi:hypothetical protein